MTELQDLKPYKKKITWSGSKVRWCKVVDKNNVPLVNFPIPEDKADFIINRINSYDALLTACQKLTNIAEVVGHCVGKWTTEHQALAQEYAAEGREAIFKAEHK